MLKRAFTLIELLLVIAIIAVLASLAVFNFTEAGTRAKVARVKNDLRSIDTALQAYAADTNAFPPQNDLGTTPTQLSTPVAYLQRAALRDPFYNQSMPSEQDSLYRYTNFEDALEASAGDLNHEFAAKYYGSWMLYSNAPFQQVARTVVSTSPEITIITAYDPTNGTVSPGRIIRSPRRS